MSLLSKFAPALVVLAVAPASMAGISDLAQKTEPTKVESMARIAKPTVESNTFTCWQEGRQIYQAKGVVSSNVTQSTIELAAKDRAISLMDMKNGFCIFERTGNGTNKNEK